MSSENITRVPKCAYNRDKSSDLIPKIGQNWLLILSVIYFFFLFHFTFLFFEEEEARWSNV